MLTVMGKMVQQIATINNLLIFINMQISQLQKSNEGRASGEGPVMAGTASLPPQAGEGQGSCQLWGREGAPLAAPGPLIPDPWGLGGGGGLIPPPRLVRARSFLALGSLGSREPEAPVPDAHDRVSESPVLPGVGWGGG